MNNQSCLSQDIIEINKNKEYTLISTDILENVLTDARLNAQTSKLWQILFNRARYNPNLEVKISYSYLAKTLNKSTRTIARYIESLQRAGYLIIKHNFDENGGQRPNTIFVRVPASLIEHAKKKKDRVNKKCFFINDSLVDFEKYKLPKKDLNEASPMAVSLTSSELSQNIVLCETIQRPCDMGNISVEEDIKTECTLGKSVSCINREDKSDRGWYDINVIQKDINEKEIKNNNIVVCLSQEQQKIVAIQNEIERLEKNLIDGDKKISGIKDHATLYTQIKKNSEIEASLFLAKNALEKIKNEKNEKTKHEKIIHDLNNPRFMLDKIGERPLSLSIFKRLVTSLASYGYHGDALYRLVNEIVFESRFGSLVNCNKTKKSLSLDKAVNIGLKLVREKRWSTPNAFMENIQSGQEGK